MRICVIGSGTRFLSGISYYTLRLANALSEVHDVSVITMRQLLPARLYPGRARVGASLTDLRFAPKVQAYDGVDWHWITTLPQALAFLRRMQPDVIVFQWWTGAVLHSYLALATAARQLGAKVVIEFHEVLDTAEAQMPLVRAYAGTLVPMLTNKADGFVIHSEFDRAPLQQGYRIGPRAGKARPIALIPHGPYDHHQTSTAAAAPAGQSQPDQVCNVLFFGTIRPYKGLEDLITAFNALSAEEAARYRLTIVGETWEGWTQPTELIAQSPHKARITFINRYVRDEEVAGFFAGANVVALPYHRSSASGPLHIAMSHGLPVVVTQVGGLAEAAEGYTGAIFVQPRRPDLLWPAVQAAQRLSHVRHADPQSWANTVARYTDLFKQITQLTPALPAIPQAEAVHERA